nr:hypothetical protein [Saprospiraceae bacterium]
MKEIYKNTTDLNRELDEIHPGLRKYAGKSGFDIPIEKMEHLAENFARSQGLKPKNTLTHLLSGPWMRGAAAAVIVIAIAFSVYFTSDYTEQQQPLVMKENIDLYFDFLHQEIESMEREWIIESFGDLYLEAVTEGSIDPESYRELYYLEDIELIY